MLAAVGLTYRFAPLARSAELLLVDLSEGQVVRRCWLPTPLFDLTPGDRLTGGGRQRGARGVVARAGAVHVATFDAIHTYDERLRCCGSVSCDRFCDIHEFAVSDEGFLVTCSRMDALTWCDRSGRVDRLWCATEDAALLAAGLGIPPIARTREHDWRSLYPPDNPTHLNAVSCDGQRTLVALHNQGVMWSVEEGRVWHDARPVGAGKTHNHTRLDDGRVVLNDTLHGMFFKWNGADPVVIDVSAPGRCPARPTALSAPWAVEHGWLRGLASLAEDHVLVGQCPAKLVVLDLQCGAIARVIPLHDDWRVSVNGLAIL